MVRKGPHYHQNIPKELITKKGLRPENDLVLDNRSHAEVSEILNKSKYFVTYDPYTHYTSFALQCGCLPIIMPFEGKTKNEWYPDRLIHNGIAYGNSQSEIEFAISTRKIGLERIAKRETERKNHLRTFARLLSCIFC